MDGLGNPFAVLTFIVAPAILTNASSIMGLATSNRFARSMDRARLLAADLQKNPGVGDERALRVRQLEATGRRALLQVRAMTAFYTSVGSFAAASLASLLGAIFVVFPHELARHAAMAVGLVTGVVGVSGLVYGTSLLFLETRTALRILSDETRFVLQHLPRQPGEMRDT